MSTRPLASPVRLVINDADLLKDLIKKIFFIGSEAIPEEVEERGQ